MKGRKKKKKGTDFGTATSEEGDQRENREEEKKRGQKSAAIAPLHPAGWSQRQRRKEGREIESEQQPKSVMTSEKKGGKKGTQPKAYCLNPEVSQGKKGGRKKLRAIKQLIRERRKGPPVLTYLDLMTISMWARKEKRKKDPPHKQHSTKRVGMLCQEKKKEKKRSDHLPLAR